MAVAYTQSQINTLAAQYGCAANATAVTDAIANAAISAIGPTKRNQLTSAVYSRLSTIDTRINAGYYDTLLSSQSVDTVAAAIVVL